MSQLTLCRAGDVTEEEPYQAVLPGHPAFAVYRVGEAFYVTQDECTHATASLALEGQQEGFHITCSWHDACFDIRTGIGVSGPCEKPLRSFPVTVADGEVRVEIG